MRNRTDSPLSSLRYGIALALGTAAFSAAASLAPGAAPPAVAGSYRAAICDPSLGAGRADASFRRSSSHYRPRASCAKGGTGLAVSHDARRTSTGRWGGWAIQAPLGLAISRLRLSAAGRSDGGHLPELAVGPLAGPLAVFASPGRGLHRVAWSGSPARLLVARLRCRRHPRCGAGGEARIRVKRILARLDDRAAPKLNLAGSLLAPGSRRGLQAIKPVASDLGGGVRRLLLQVNGEPVTAHTVACRLAGAIALRLRPCPTRAAASFAAATASPPFRQGPNLVRICAADHAATTAANRTCARRRVRVDNLCPVSAVPGGTTLRAHLSGGVRHLTLPRRRETEVSGRLLSATGGAISGARLCVAVRTRLAGVPERVIATSTTGADGRFRATIPPGPSREVRVAYWPPGGSAVERYLDLEVRARPHLRLRPRDPIQNGGRVRFRVRLPGPANAGRRVAIQVHANRRWLDLRGGRTGPRGIYRARYRFHATTGRRHYAFRATVPRQRGYPYERGISRVRHVTVVG